MTGVPTPLFIPDDGTGLDTANAYIPQVFADQYHSNAGNDYWGTIADNLKQFAIVRSSAYVDKRFGPKFRGTRRRRTQGLMWPRLGAYDNDGFYIDTIPTQIMAAVCEYAMRAVYYNVLAPDPQRPVPGQDMTVSPGPSTDPDDVITGQVQVITEKVGPLETSTRYITNAEIIGKSKVGDTRAPQSFLVNDFFIPEYPEAELWIEALLRSPFGTATLTRGD